MEDVPGVGEMCTRILEHSVPSFWDIAVKKLDMVLVLTELPG